MELSFSRAAFADADSMLAAGGSYRWDNTSTEGNLSMMIFFDFGLRGGLGPRWGAQTSALERLILAQSAGCDVRFALVALALHSLVALELFVQNQLASWAHNIMTRAWQGACFAAELTDADSTVAAGRSQGRALFRAIGSLA
jgi:hypothetical protein